MNLLERYLLSKNHCSNGDKQQMMEIFFIAMKYWATIRIRVALKIFKFIVRTGKHLAWNVTLEYTHTSHKLTTIFGQDFPSAISWSWSTVKSQVTDATPNISRTRWKGFSWWNKLTLNRPLETKVYFQKLKTLVRSSSVFCYKYCIS